MFFLLLKISYIFIMALVLAILEVQIEGANGWAANLPTWRPSEKKKYVKFFKKVMGGKEMTGYHLSMFSFVILIFHFPFFFRTEWNLISELDILSIFFLFIVVWDYLWFVVNPSFTIKNFRHDYIFWHKKWLFGLPLDYWFSVFISFLIAIIISFFFLESYIIIWLIMLFVFIVLTLILKFSIKILKPEWE